MERRKFFLMAAGSVAALMTGAAARPDDHGRGDHGRGDDHGHGGDHGGGHGGGHDDWGGRDHRNWRDDRGGWHNDHDRYWRNDYGRRGYMDRDRIFGNLRRHHYNRFVGDPYWFQGRYIVRTYDRWGNVIFVEVDPYSGDFLGVIRF
jgi:opacity protein-like surface antigen